METWQWVIFAGVSAYAVMFLVVYVVDRLRHADYSESYPPAAAGVLAGVVGLESAIGALLCGAPLIAALVFPAVGIGLACVLYCWAVHKVA